MDFEKFEKVARLGTKETEGILKGDCWFSPKLDGTNGSVWLGQVPTDILRHEPTVQYGSRNRHLAIGSDNAGFMATMRNNEALTSLLYDYPTWRVFGEWLVPHTIKEYRDDAWRKFYVYDIQDAGTFLSPEVWQYILEQEGIDYIPHFKVSNPDMAVVEDCLDKVSNWLMKDGEIGEGIVIKNYGFTNRYGDMRYAKYINEGFQDRPKKVATDHQTETDLAELCVTEGLVQKNADKIIWASAGFMAQIGQKPDWDRKTMMPKLMQNVYHDVMTEKLEAALEEMKMPTVNFKVFRGAVSRAIKDNGKEFF